MIGSDRGDDDLVLEGLVTTTSEDGTTNVSPMGPIVDRAIGKMRLRPFRTSRTYANLKRTGHGVFHVTDDVELLAAAAIGELTELPPLQDCPQSDQKILSDACRWYFFEVVQFDDREARTDIRCRVLQSGRLRDFFGWNRAQHAVLEAAILATRIHLLPIDGIMRQLEELGVIVEKRAGILERRAYRMVLNYVQNASESAKHSRR